MSAFYGIAAGLCIIAAALLTRPRWWPRGRSRPGSITSRVDDLARQLSQLKLLHSAGALSDEHYAQSRQVVERKVLDALAEPASPSDDRVRPSNALIAATVAFLAVVAGGGYAWLGSSGHSVAEGAASQTSGDASSGAADAAGAPHALTSEQMVAMIERLSERLKGQPDDAEGWQMLARSYVVVGKHVESIDAFRRAVQLRPDDANLLADYADALAVTRDRQIEGEPLALVERALKAAPKNGKALALAGTAAFDRRDYKAAVAYWEKAADVESADGALAAQLQSGIAEARQLGGMAPAPSAASAPALASPAAQVSGTVSLADALRDKVAPDDTLFIYARAVDGPRMPLSILRKRVRDLPFRFALDDSLAMSPDAKLSSVARVVVGARISKSGNAMPQSGDLQGFAAESAVGASGVRVVIDQTVTR